MTATSESTNPKGPGEMDGELNHLKGNDSDVQSQESSPGSGAKDSHGTGNPSSGKVGTRDENYA